MIPLFRPSCSDREIERVTRVLRSGWWRLGPETEELERKFREFAGTRHAVAVNSATMGLQLTCEALRVRGGEIIMPALTFAATGLAAVHNGCRIVFADINENTLCMDWDDAAAKITPHTRAVIPVWYGGTVIMPSPAWQSRPLEFDIPVIEDCAHAAGSSLAGHLGFAACWSFETVKNIAAGDGGMVTTNSSELAARLRRSRWFGIDRSTWDRSGQAYSWDYDIPSAGWKANMNDITAAIALAQLERLDEMNKARKMVALRYLDELKDLEWLRLPSWREDSAWHLFAVRTENRDDLIRHMQVNGVSAGVHYRPLNTYEAFGRQELPVTDRVWKTLVTLPLFTDMTEDEVTQVIQVVRSWNAVR